MQASANLPIPKPTRDPRHPIDDTTWEGWFDAAGKPRITFEQFRGEVFRRVSVRAVLVIICMQYREV